MGESKYRHEHKYLISTQTALLLKARLSACLPTDRHAKDGRYSIRSLYFDDAADSGFFSKINGEDMRAKYRIRFYDMDDRFISLEKKEKHGSMTRKTSARIAKDAAKQLALGNADVLRDSTEPLLAEFYALSRSALLSPAVIVDYDRFPFVYPHDRVRITIDANVTSGGSCFDLFDANAPAFPALPDGTVILEVKTDDRLPDHIRYLIEDLPRQEQAISKYCLCREFCQ